MIAGQPEVFLVASTHIEDGLDSYLKAIGDPAWISDAKSDGDLIVEAAGRLCYRSWQAYDPRKPLCSNPNVTKVRERNDQYIGNILSSGHGSVLEHVNATFIFKHFSRVFTHEIVRHRAGMGFSQESLRYVRLDQLVFWIPPSVYELGEDAVQFFITSVETLERMQLKLAEISGIETLKDFAKKKRLTSMMRRLAPIGLATTIMVTGNMRAWRHIINMRTNEAAEEEMRLAIGQVAPILKGLYPSIMQDLECQDDGSWKFALGEKV